MVFKCEKSKITLLLLLLTMPFNGVHFSDRQKIDLLEARLEKSMNDYKYIWQKYQANMRTSAQVTINLSVK